MGLPAWHIIHSHFVRVLHSLTKHECFPPPMSNKFRRTFSNEQVMGVTEYLYNTLELMVRLFNN